MPDTSLLQLIQTTADEIGFPSAVAIEQLRIESGNFRPDVIYGPYIGNAGERGLAQFIPATWARFGNGDPYNPTNSMQAWQRFIQYLANLFPGDLRKILQAYNGGEGNVQRNTVSSAAQNYADKILRQAGQNPPNNASQTFLDPELPTNSLSAFSIFGLSPVYSILLAAGIAGITLAVLSSRD